MIRLPAEWEPQSAVLMTWPRADGDFAGDYLAVAACFREIARHICRFEKLIVSFDTEAQRQAVMADLREVCPIQRLRDYVAPNNDVWARDHGPIGVRGDDGPVLLKFGFDGWGGKYPSARDNHLAWALARAGAFGPLDEQPIVLEGGAIETDGAGTLLATRRSVLDPLRNPGWSASRIEALLREQLGLTRFLWLDHGGLAGDDTDGHIDTLARFVNAETIVYQDAGGAGEPNADELEAMREELGTLRRADGEPYALLPLPSPGVHRGEDGALLPASYANYLVINGAVLVPGYGVAADDEAQDCLRRTFPGREIVGIDCRALIRQYGSLHCVTMNLPA